MSKSKIEWTDVTWSPVTGCTKLSAGCRNCYAERMARRLAGRFGYPEAPNHFDVTLHPDRLDQPLRWKKPRRIFVCSMSDLFHPSVPFLFIDSVMDVIYQAKWHTFQVLTKRPARLLEWIRHAEDRSFDAWTFDWFPHVWFGVSIESPEYSYRASVLSEIPAAVRFVSFEPLLASFADYPGVLDDIDWAIAGGESGPGARPMNLKWPRDLRDQCVAAGTAFHFKQWGAWFPRSQWEDNPDLVLPDDCDCKEGRNLKIIDGDIFHRVGKKAAGRLLDGRTWDQIPTPPKPHTLPYSD